jgi:hypothetical protein
MFFIPDKAGIARFMPVSGQVVSHNADSADG